MKIGVNLRTLVPGKIGGLETYIRAILEHIRRSDLNHEVVIFGSVYNISTLQFDDPRFRTVLLNDADPMGGLSAALAAERFDVWFCPLLVLEPQVIDVPAVVQIPDLQHEFFPDFFSPQVLAWRRQHFGYSVRRADAVLTLSEHSKQTIVDRLGGDPSKTHAIHLAVDDEYYGAGDPAVADEVRRTLNLPDHYLYFPANTWPHKNHLTMLKAMKILKEKYGRRIPLLLTGAKSEGHGQVQQAIAELGLQDDVRLLGYVQRPHLPYVYRAATALVFPSLFEGFGIPPLEAMAAGCPVIASTAASIPEIVGEAALLCDPHDPEAFAQAIDRLLADPSLRTDLIRRGHDQVRLYSWTRATLETLRVLEDAAKRPLPKRDQPLVSIITPSYNQGQFIRETIESILTQDYENIEYIVCDGGSTDQTVEILKSYGDRIRWVSERDGGQADAVNKGLAMARGAIIGWLNSDDTYYPGAVRRAVEFFRWQPDAVMVYGEGHYTDEQGRVTDRYPTEQWNYDRLGENCFICQPTAFMRADALRRVNGLDASLHYCMDYELWMRLGQIGPVGYLQEFTATSRLYADNKTLGQRAKVFREITAVVRKRYGYVPLTWVQGYTDYLMGGTIEHPASPSSARFLLTGAALMLRFNWHRPGYVLKEFKRVLSHLWHTRVVKPQQFTEQWPDGWVSRHTRLHVSVPNGAARLVLKARHLAPKRPATRVVVTVNGRRVGRVTLSATSTTPVVLRLPAVLEGGTAVVELKADHSFVPAKVSSSTDTRDLSWILDSIQFLEGEAS
jgi:glycosyltransferase involved in cell wall biosynthesis